MAPSDNQYHHLHWSSLLFDALAQVRHVLLPAVFAILGAARGNTFWLWIAGFFFFPGVLYSVFRYLTLTYSIHDGKFIVSRGLIFRNVRTVPVARIQNIDFIQTLLHRFFGVAELKIETAAGSEPEASLRVLSLQQIESLRSEVFRQRDLAQSSSRQNLEIPEEEKEPTATAEEAVPQEVLLQIPFRKLLQVGVASNRGMVMVGLMLGLAFQSDIPEQLDLQLFTRLIPEDWDRNVWILLGGCLIAATLLLLRLLSIAWYVLRFSGYSLIRCGDDLRISCGLLTKVSATVPRQRIQLISVYQNLLMRWMGLSSIRIETAGGTQSHEDASKSVSGRWFIPVVSTDGIDCLVRQLRPTVDWSQLQTEFQPISSRASQRSLRLAFLGALALGLIGLAIVRPWGGLAGLLALPLLICFGRADVRNTMYAWSPEGIMFKSGVFTRKTSMTFFEKIQSIECHQNPLDRRWGMAGLSIDTAASGPADHRISIPMLDQQTAIAELRRFTCLASTQQPAFR